MFRKASQGLKGSQLFSIYYLAGVLPPLHSNYYLSGVMPPLHILRSIPLGLVCRKVSQGLKASQLFSIYHLDGVMPPLHIFRSIPFVLVF